MTAVRARRAPAALLALWGAAALAQPGPGQPAPAAAEAPAPPRAAEVRLELPPGDDRAAAEALLEVAAGQPVTRRALRRTATRLFQSGRCRDVVIRQAPATPPAGQAGAWVSLQVTCLAQRLLATLEVRLQGASPLDEVALRAAASLEPGSPVDDTDLAAATDRVRAALRRRGHRGPEVAATLSGERSAAVVLSVRAGPATLVAEVALPGAGLEEQALRRALSLRPGAVLDEERLAEDLKALRRALHAAGRWRARLGAPVVRDVEGGVRLELPVQPGPLVRVVFRGQRVAEARTLTDRLGLEPEEPFDAPAVDAAVERLRAWYRSRGFARARLEVEERPAGAELAVVVHVDEGPRLRLAGVRFEGGAWRGDDALRERLLAQLAEDAPAEAPSPATERARALEASFPAAPPLAEPPPGLPPGGYLDEVLLQRAAERIVEGYRADGFLEAALLGWSAEADEARGEVRVVLKVREGERTTIESIGFEGNEKVPLADLARESKLAPGAPLVYEQVEATRLALLRLYLVRSHVYARVEAREELDPVRHAVALRFVVDEGPRVKVGRILVVGNTRTRDDVVRRSLEVKEGAWHDPEALARSQAALLRLGVFRSVGLRLQDPEVPEPVKDLVVEVSERPWQYLAPGLGYSIANGPRAFVEYGRPNLLGRALELTARAKVNYPLAQFGRTLEPASPKNTFEGRALVGLRAPRLDALPWPVALQTTALAERVHRRAYDLKRASGILAADAAVTSRVAVSLQYEVEVDEIQKTQATVGLTQADVERLRFDQGTTTLHGLRPVLTLDFRDNAAHPHRGWYATGSIEADRSLGGPGGRFLFLRGSQFFTELLKLEGTISGYLPVGRSTVLALSLRGGRVVPLSAKSRTILPKRFYLGGASTVRGFAEEEMVPEDLRSGIAQEAGHCQSSISGVGCTSRGAAVASGTIPASEGGEVFVLMKGELRVTLRQSLEAGLFVDVGNLWLDPTRYRLLDARPSAGLGLRFVTPVGPAALDVGFNLAPDRRLNERTFAPHFTIGLF